MNYSKTMIGILAMIALPALVTFGFSDSCSNEILAKGTPLLAALPGAIMAWIGRVQAGGVTMGGFRK